LETPGKKRSEQRGEKLYLKNLSSPSASPDVFPSLLPLSLQPLKRKTSLGEIGVERQIQIDLARTIDHRAVCDDTPRVQPLSSPFTGVIFIAAPSPFLADVARVEGGKVGNHERYEMETDARPRPREDPLSKFGSFHVERCPQGGHLYVLRGSFDGLAGFAVPETDTTGEPQRTRMDAPLTWVRFHWPRGTRCDGGVKCAVITGDRRKAGKKVVNMTPIFLVVLLAIHPIIAQNSGE
ncbi:hypothetical protein X777_12731, partial [Ooceraea biroi]